MGGLARRKQLKVIIALIHVEYKEGLRIEVKQTNDDKYRHQKHNWNVDLMGFQKGLGKWETSR